MLTPRPHLTTRRPSPSTASYTVSTALPCRTLPSHCLHYILQLHRILLGLGALLALAAKAFAPTSPPLAPLSDALAPLPWAHVGPLGLACLFLVLRRFHAGMPISSPRPRHV